MRPGNPARRKAGLQLAWTSAAANAVLLPGALIVPQPRAVFLLLLPFIAFFAAATVYGARVATAEDDQERRFQAWNAEAKRRLAIAAGAIAAVREFSETLQRAIRDEAARTHPEGGRA